jgi:PEP-CTERM motif
MRTIWEFVPAAFLFCAATAAQASTITVLNPSFEDDVLSCTPSSPGCGTNNSITDWTGSTAYPGGFDGVGVDYTGDFGVYDPGTVSYPGGVPNGVNVAYVQAIANSASISQTLSATLQANDTYTLTVWEGLRDDTGVIDPGLGCNGSNISLEADGTVLNSLANETTVTCPSVRGAFQEFTVTFNSAGVNPALLGDALEIVLTANGSGSIYEPSEIDFDAVSLSDTLGTPGTGTAVPEPGSLAIMAAAFIGIVITRRRLAA